MREYAPLALVVAASLALWAFFRIDTGICLEDALITYRYAENLALGEGFVFNPGERVLGTTTPLFTLMLAASGLLFGVEQIPLASNLLSAIFGQLAGLLTFAALRRLGFSAAVCTSAAALFLFQPDVVVAATGGMETMLVVALMAGSFYALSADRNGTAVVLCALLVIARIDGILWAAIVMLLVCWERPGSTLRYGLLFCGAVAPWALFAQLYFGSVLPHSMLAKLAIGRPGEPLGELDTLAAHMRWFLGATGIHTRPIARGADSMIVLAVTVILALAGLASVLREAASTGLARRRPVSPASVCRVLPRAHPQDLSLVPGPPPLVLLHPGRDRGRPGVGRGSRSVRSSPNSPPGSRGVRRIASPDPAAAPDERRPARARPPGAHAGLRGWAPAPASVSGSRRIPQRERRVATEAIGYQGYYSKRRIIDLAGLTSREVVSASRESRRNSAATFHRVLKRTRPDYIVLRSFEVDQNRAFHGGRLFQTRAQRSYFDETYVELQRFQVPGFGGRSATSRSSQSEIRLSRTRRKCLAPSTRERARCIGEEEPRRRCAS